MYETIKMMLKDNIVIVGIIGALIAGFGVLEFTLWIEHIIKRIKIRGIKNKEIEE